MEHYTIMSFICMLEYRICLILHDVVDFGGIKVMTSNGYRAPFKTQNIFAKLLNAQSPNV